MAAATNARFEEETAALVNGGEAGHAGEVWLRQGDYGGQMVIHANGRVIGNGSIRLKGVSIYIQVVGESGNLEFNRRIEAAEAVLIPGYWRLSNARDARADSPVAFSRWLSVPSTLDPASAMEKFVAPAAVAFWDLPAAVSSAEMAGYSSTAYRLRYQQLLAAPLLLAAMTVLAAMFSLRLLRLGDMVALAASGVTLGFGVFFLNQLCGALGATSVIPVEVAAWAPPTLALLSGVTLLCYTEDG
jgi:lipopolysaccharide export system permease protein